MKVTGSNPVCSIEKCVDRSALLEGQTKLDDKTITDGDLLALGAGTSVRNSRAKVEDAKEK